MSKFVITVRTGDGRLLPLSPEDQETWLKLECLKRHLEEQIRTMPPPPIKYHERQAISPGESLWFTVAACPECGARWELTIENEAGVTTWVRTHTGGCEGPTG